MHSFGAAVVRGVGAVVVNFVVLTVASLAISAVYPTYMTDFQALIDRGVFRDHSDLRMSYVFVSPLVETLLVCLAVNHLGLRVQLPPSSSSSSLLSRAAKFALALYAVGAFPGLLIDYGTFPLPGTVLVVFMLCSYLSQLVVALALLY